ncbi:MAG: hypothetical protein WD535_02500, partial [Thermaerobacterales bacterium]
GILKKVGNLVTVPAIALAVALLLSMQMGIDKAVHQPQEEPNVFETFIEPARQPSGIVPLNTTLHPGISDLDALAVALARQLYHELHGGDTAFLRELVGQTSVNRLEVVIERPPHTDLVAFLSFEQLSAPLSMMDFITWLRQSALQAEIPYVLIDDHHTETYRNIFLQLPHGYFWVQFDDTGHVSKLYALPFISDYDQAQLKIAIEMGALVQP